MTKHALTIVALALAWTTPALAQDGAEADVEVGTDDEASMDASPASPYDEPPPTAPQVDEPSSSSPYDEPPPSNAPSSDDGADGPAPAPAPRSTHPASAPQATASQQPVVIVNRRHRDEDDEDEPEPQSPPDSYDILYVELVGGASYVDLRAIQVNNYYPEFVELKGVGGGGGVAAGFRIEFFSVGVRGTLSHYDVVSMAGTPSSFDVGTAAAEVTLSLPLPVVRPFIRAGFGLGWHGDAGVAQVWTSMAPPTDVETTVFGWVFQGAIGLDVFLADWFSLGAAFSLDVLNMSRHSWNEDPPNPGGVSFRQSGDAVGLQARGQIAVSFHF